MPYIIKFAHVIKQRLEPGLIFTLYSLKYEAFCIWLQKGKPQMSEQRSPRIHNALILSLVNKNQGDNKSCVYGEQTDKHKHGHGHWRENCTWTEKKIYMDRQFLPVVALFEHVLALWVERPVISLAFSSALPWHLDETLVQRQIVTNGILPAFLVLLVEREFVDDELVDLGQS